MVSLVNGSTALLLMVIIYLWEKYLQLKKLFTVNNNYIRLIKHLPLIELFTVNNNNLPFIKIFTVNKIVYS